METIYANKNFLNGTVEEFCKDFKATEAELSNIAESVDGVNQIKDSGQRRVFESGAVRDIVEGKGRCDLMPLSVIKTFLNDDPVLSKFAEYMKLGDIHALYSAADRFTELFYPDKWSAVLDAAKQYEGGAVKYGEHNWEKGIPLHSFIDSAIRHYLKARRGDNDEPHIRACLWNIFGAIWTQQNKPEQQDIQYEDVLVAFN